jgi:hypothetical protein
VAKADKKSSSPSRASRAEAVRAAVDQAFHATQSQLSRDRAVELADELAAAAGRVRDALEELRPAGGEELRRLAERVDALEQRLGALERARRKAPAARGARAKPAPKPKPAPKGS